MALTQKDLNNIKDIVEFSIEKSEQRTDLKFEGIDKRFEKLSSEFKNELHSLREEMHREISDIASTNREFLAKLGNHETRIIKLETKIA